MMRRFVFLALMTGFLMGCDSPHPAFMSVEAQTIKVRGSTFKVRIKDDKVEVIRTNFERIPKIGDTFPKAAEAIEIASGCSVVPGSMKGDPALMMARIKCAYD